ncbi:hypothetical protein CMI45_02410 [Candidatus Pacearchaeota archaeon]|nr:hypothetical protein [Candidatus Pacearchaeota archaeon]|tara:strand:- start:231 stop:836 length:606 start_codon:yes stop_codon:yes gene_type:complete
MKLIKKITKNIMIGEFLRAEIDSPRFSKRIKKALKRDKKTKEIIIKPNFDIVKDNKYRKKLLGEVRGYPNERIFHNFPTDIKWELVFLNEKELKKIKYINWDYWNKITKNSRKPEDAVKNIKSGVKIKKADWENFDEIVKVIKINKKIPLIILVAKNKRARKVVLEGHARLTAYLYEPRLIKKGLNVIIGYSDKISNWNLY